MFSDLHLTNVAVFEELRWTQHSRVNVIIGENDTGKSHLLKMLYVLAKSVEEYTRARKSRAGTSWQEVLATKLRWTFQPSEALGELVLRGADSLEVSARLYGADYRFSLSWKSIDSVAAGTEDAAPQERGNALFIPPKEILTAFAAIAVTRETLEIFGFDDTYFDLIKALRVPTTQGNIEANLKQVLAALDALFQGRIVRARAADAFVFERGQDSYGMSQTADGIKKVGILETLIRNRTLNRHTLLFLDEPEVNLHPRAIALFTEMLFRIGQAGVQVYLATHSYFVIKQLQILAKQHQQSVTLCSLSRQEGQVTASFSDLREGMPDNPIVESTRRFGLPIMAVEEAA